MMIKQTKRGVMEGVGFGLIAGVIFAAVEIIAAAILGNQPMMPVRLFASVLLGPSALQSAPLDTAVVVGYGMHLTLSAFYGLVYGVANALLLSPTTERSLGRQAELGLFYGLAIWLVNYQLIARMFYPWFLEPPQFLHMAMHALCFGLPLALMYAGGERQGQVGPTHRSG